MSSSNPAAAHNYRPDIDGLRAIAVLSVVCFHAFPSLLHGGFAGVDVFFVISGYLISTIIFQSLERGNFSIARFYERRVRRIFPALIAVMVTTLIVGWYVLVSDEFVELGKHTIAGTLFVQNFVLWSESGYFDRVAELKPLLHLWSLAVEEQFYIFWPVLLALCWKRGWNLLNVAAVIFVLSFGINLYLTWNDPTAAYYSPLSRFWELMIGGILAYLQLHRPQTLAKGVQLQSTAGILLLALGFVLIDKNRGFPGYWALLPTLGSALLISAGMSGWVNRWVLAFKPMVWVGLISYPLYLWHWPILSFLRIVDHDPSRWYKLAAVILSVLAAWATYLFIEKPVRFKLKKVAAPLVFASLAVLGFGTLGYFGTWDTRNPVNAQMMAAVTDWEYPGGMDELPGAQFPSYQVKGQSDEVTLFLGDSHIEQYSPRVVEVLKGTQGDFNTVRFVTDGGCPPIPGVFEDHPKHKDCEKQRQVALDASRDPKVRKIVVGACWNCYFVGGFSEKDDLYEYYYRGGNSERLPLLTPAGLEAAMQELQAMLTDLSKDRTVYLLLDNPAGKAFNPRNYISGSRLAQIHMQDMPLHVLPDEKQEALRRRLMEIAKQSNAIVIDPVPSLCGQAGCVASTDQGVPLYKDSDHLRPFLVRTKADYIDVSFRRMQN